MDVLASIIFPNCTCRDELINVCYREENDYLTAHGGELYPDVEKTLDELSESYDLYIVSNCQRGYIESFLRTTDLAGILRILSATATMSLRSQKT